MVSDFLLPWSRLNLLSLDENQQQDFISSVIPLEAATYFEFGQDEGYWDGKKLLDLIRNRTVPIFNALYPGYEALFLFNNATSHASFSEDALRVAKMSKGPGGQQAFLRDGWYMKDGQHIEQKMWFFDSNGVKTQKGIQMVLGERGLWPEAGFQLPTVTSDNIIWRKRNKLRSIILGRNVEKAIMHRYNIAKMQLKLCRNCYHCRRCVLTI